MLFRGEQVVVPYAYQKKALTCLHTCHLGIVKCTERAKTTLYWPGYVRDIQEMVEKCSQCQANRNVSAHEPLIPTPVPECPFQKVGADLFTLDGVTYLLTVDYYSHGLLQVVIYRSVTRYQVNRCNKRAEANLRRFRKSRNFGDGWRSTIWKP